MLLALRINVLAKGYSGISDDMVYKNSTFLQESPWKIWKNSLQHLTVKSESRKFMVLVIIALFMFSILRLICSR